MDIAYMNLYDIILFCGACVLLYLFPLLSYYLPYLSLSLSLCEKQIYKRIEKEKKNNMDTVCPSISNIPHALVLINHSVPDR
jgi:hypothetical protein